MTSILLEPCDPADYSASAELLSISPSDMQVIANHVGFDDPQFLSRLDKFEEHLNSELSFEQYVSLMDELPCPCPTCIIDSGMTTVEYAITFLQKLQTSWATLINVVEPYSTPPNSPVGESFPYEAPQTSPTNQEMHAMNGNHIHTKLPFVRDVADVLNGVHEAYEEIPNIIEKFRSKGKYSSDEAMRHYKKYFSNHPSGRYFDAGTPEYDEWWNLYQQTLKPAQLEKLKKISNKEQHATNGNPKWDWKPTHKNIGDAETIFDREAKGENARVMASSGPTNKEMHSYNGNPPKMGPRTKAQHARTERKKIRNAKKRAETKAYLKVIKGGTAPYPQNRPKRKLPKGTKSAAKKDSQEKQIAKRYASFLKTPSFAPPRLGSTGSVPTKILHGYFKATYNMSAPGFGVNTVTNATALIAYINPKMFTYFSTPSNYVAPISIGFATTGAISFNSSAGSSSTNTFGNPAFANTAALKAEVGYDSSLSSNTLPGPKSRWLGGSISLECRCPMATVSPPYLFGGLLPSDYAANNNSAGTLNVSVSNQLNQLSADTIRQLPFSTDVPGYEVSSIYLPNSPEALNFDTMTAQWSDNATMVPSAVPYVGMTGCPTSGTVTLHVSCWFEIQQTANNSLFASGWKLGPKVSSEDIYDHLPTIRPIKPHVINIGSKQAGFSLSSYLESIRKPEQPTMNFAQELAELKSQINHLRLKIDEEEDEKYFDVEATPSLDKQDTPIYKGLSKSTLDLAMSLKKSLTPGSVTHKTVQNTMQ